MNYAFASQKPLFSGEKKRLDTLDLADLKRCREALKQVDEVLSEKTYLTGDEITLADMAIMSSLSAPQGAGWDLQEYKHLTRWLKALEVDIPYAVYAAFDETTEIIRASLRKF